MLHRLTKNFSPISHICPIGLLKKTPKSSFIASVESAPTKQVIGSQFRKTKII